jgi:(p)ppGpp synthase/HD superfamily hydrolase
MTERLHRAIDLAARAHDGQRRKDVDLALPYVSHVYGVAMLLAVHGFPEDVIIAGLLHDVLEDAPQFAAEVAAFGPDVLRWVRTVTDPKKHDEQGHDVPWDERKGVYIEQIRRGEPEAMAVACADKIMNMESSLMSAERGQGLLFSRPLEVQIRYFRRVREAFGDWRHPLLARYDELLARLAARR